jgi:stage II sporulation protein D
MLPILIGMTREVLAVLVCVSSTACGSPAGRPTLPAPLEPAPWQLRVQVVEREALVVKDVALEDYVRATAISEFAPGAEAPEVAERMLEVQAVIGRTYAVSHLGRHAREGFDLCATTHCQLFDPGRLATSRWSAAAAQAADRTAGIVVWFQGAPAEAFFHADCGGHTSAASAVWGGENRSYLRAQPDTDAARDVHARWEYRADVDAVAAALVLDPRIRSGPRLTTLAVVARDDAGRAERVAIHADHEIQVRGEELRQALTRAFGGRTIRSTRFDIRREGSTIVFSGRGHGHGVGLCQVGALARLRAGTVPTDVLNHYYPGTTLRPLPTTMARARSLSSSWRTQQD